MKFITNIVKKLFSTEDTEPIKYDNHCPLCNFTAETKEELETHLKNTINYETNKINNISLYLLIT